MELYLLNNNKYFVLAGSCNESDSDTYEDPKDWNDKSEWNDTESQYFHKLLELTDVQASIDKHLRTPSVELERIKKVDLETHKINPAPDNSTASPTSNSLNRLAYNLAKDEATSLMNPADKFISEEVTDFSKK